MLPTTRVNPNVKEPWASDSPQPRLILDFEYGLNENTTPDIGECIAGYNFDLQFSRKSQIARMPFDLKGTATNAGAITGFLQLVKRDNTETTLAVAGNTVYLWDGASTFTSKGTVTAPALLRGAYWSLGDYLIIADVSAKNVLKKWDGTTFVAATTGLASPLIAKYVIQYLNRIWLFNITYNGVSYPHMILVSAFEDPTTYNNLLRGGPAVVGGGVFTTGLESFFLLVPDLKPINGVTVFANNLIISTTNGRIWVLSGTSGSTFQFTDFMDTTPAIGTEAMMNIGNDVVFLTQGGKIQRMSSTQTYGNVFTSNLGVWLPTTLAGLAGVSQIVYDRQNQRVLFFIANKVLVLYKDILAEDNYGVATGHLIGKSPWGVYVTSDASQFNTSAAIFMLRPGTTIYSVFWGDNTGRIFDQYGVGSQDAGSNPLQVSRTSRHIGSEVISPWPWTEENLTGRIRYHRQAVGSMTLTILWDDEYSSSATTVTLKGPAANDPAQYFNASSYYSGPSYYNEGFFFANRQSAINIEPGGKGPGFYLQTDFTYNQPTQIDAVEID